MKASFFIILAFVGGAAIYGRLAFRAMGDAPKERENDCPATHGEEGGRGC